MVESHYNLATNVREAASTSNITFVANTGSKTFTKERIFSLSLGQARLIQKSGIRAGETVAVVGPTSVSLITSLVGAWILGCNTCVLPHSESLDAINTNSIRLVNDSQDIKLLFLGVKATPPLNVPTLRLDDTNLSAGPDRKIAAVTPLHQQFTSGTTGPPQLHNVSHNLIARNATDVAQRLGISSQDSILSWLPLFHDMGFVGAFAFSLVYDVPLTLIQTNMFQRNPGIWLRTLSENSSTITLGPPSAYKFVSRYSSKRRIRNLDLSSWRVGLVGSEPIYMQDLSNIDNLSGAGASTVLVPCYGMAEATLAVTVAEPESPLQTFSSGNLGETIVSSGMPLRNIEVKVKAATKNTTPGHIYIKGPTITTTNSSGWFDTGDIGFINSGQLFVVGRHKETIIIGGRNYDPKQLEEIALSVLRQRSPKYRGRIAAFQLEPRSAALVYEHESPDSATIREITRSVKEGSGVQLAICKSVQRGEVPLTTSGKVSRLSCRELITG